MLLYEDYYLCFRGVKVLEQDQPPLGNRVNLFVLLYNHRRTRLGQPLCYFFIKFNNIQKGKFRYYIENNYCY